MSTVEFFDERVYLPGEMSLVSSLGKRDISGQGAGAGHQLMMNPSAAAFHQDIKALITQSKGENPERSAKKESYGCRGDFRSAS